ncbi:MAG: acyltransferase [Fibrobacter sp.]|nr:acyltransferase [Fibrobacter sp.]
MIEILKKIKFAYLVHIKYRNISFGKAPYIGRSVYMWSRNSIKIGDYFYIGKYSQIECDAEIGNYVMFGNRVALVGRYDHKYTEIGVPIRFASKIRDRDYNWKGLDQKVVISDDVWVGYGSIILSGVHIGQGSIIAAGSVVTKNVEAYSVYAGVPAKKIGDRFDSENEKKEHISLFNSYRK